MSGMSRKEISRLIDHVQPQGVTVTRTTKGMLLRLPDDTTTMIHFTGSDHRERDNVRARLRRAGVEWPGEKHTDPLPPSITDSPPYPSSLARAAEALAGWDQRYISAAQLHRLTGLTIQSAGRCLYHLGWTPTGPTKNRKWMRPLDAEPDLITEPVAPVEAEPVEPEPVEPVEPPASREFIDTHDSWAALPSALPRDLTLGQVFAVLEAFGLDAEIRTWRARGVDAP